MDTTIQAGDTVYHAPSGETWWVLGVSTKRGELVPAGWPPTIAQLADCTLVEKGTGIKAEYRESLEQRFGADWD